MSVFTLSSFIPIVIKATFPSGKRSDGFSEFTKSIIALAAFIGSPSCFPSTPFNLVLNAPAVSE